MSDDVDADMASIDLSLAIIDEQLRSMALANGELPKTTKTHEERLAELIESRSENDALEAKLIRRTFRIVS